MKWVGVHRQVGTHRRLVTDGDEVRVVLEQTVTFYLSGNVRPDEYRHPFFVGVGLTRELADEQAYGVYVQAVGCAHDWGVQDGVTLKCRHCGVLLRTRETVVAGSGRRWPWWRMRK